MGWRWLRCRARGRRRVRTALRPPVRPPPRPDLGARQVLLAPEGPRHDRALAPIVARARDRIHLPYLRLPLERGWRQARPGWLLENLSIVVQAMPRQERQRSCGPRWAWTMVAIQGGLDRLPCPDGPELDLFDRTIRLQGRAGGRPAVPPLRRAVRAMAWLRQAEHSLKSCGVCAPTASGARPPRRSTGWASTPMPSRTQAAGLGSSKRPQSSGWWPRSLAGCCSSGGPSVGSRSSVARPRRPLPTPLGSKRTTFISPSPRRYDR